VTTLAVTHAKGFESLDEEVRIDRLEASGEVPGWLSGTLVRNGPARYEAGAETLNHWFDGLAMLHAFGFADGEVSYANRFLRTDAYRAVAEEGRIGFGEFATDPCRSIFSRVQTLFTGGDPGGANANVNVVRLGERYVAMTETPLPVRFDPQTLETLGVDRAAGPPRGQHATAHPHHDRERDELVAYVVEFGARSRYHVYSIPSACDSKRTIASLPVRHPSYMHSFALTEHYAILAEFPLVAVPLELALSGKPFIANYKWKPERGARFLVVDRNSGELRGRYETDPFFAFHHINAFERGGDLVIDLCAYDDAQIIRDFYLDRARDPRTRFAPPEPRRYTIDLDRGGVRVEPLADTVLELPRIDYRGFNMREYRYAYGVGKREASAPGFLDQLVKLDVESGETNVWHEDGCFPGEPVFLRTPGETAEDGGVLLSVVLDGRSETSFLLILDATTLDEVARASVPHHIPFGFHGGYFRA
jgi:carotenoid cleavage dioxygenase-like enzyme